jgi:hypothetical protein
VFASVMQWDQKQKFHETHEHLGLAITEVLMEKIS